MLDQRPMRILMIENDQDEVYRYQVAYSREPDAKLIAVTGSASEGLSLIPKLLPDVVLLDLELDEGDGIELLHEMEELSLPRRPFLLVITWTTVRSVLMNARKHGVGHIQSKADLKYEAEGPQMVLRYLRRMRRYFRYDDTPELFAPELEEAPVHMDNEEAEEIYWQGEIVKELGYIGITSGSVANEYLAVSIYLAAKQPRLLVDMTNDIYPELEKRFQKERGAIEISMRRCIEAVWKTADMATLCKHYKQAVSPQKGKPLLHEFISYYANQIRVRMACSR